VRSPICRHLHWNSRRYTNQSDGPLASLYWIFKDEFTLGLPPCGRYLYAEVYRGSGNFARGHQHFITVTTMVQVQRVRGSAFAFAGLACAAIAVAGSVLRCLHSVGDSLVATFAIVVTAMMSINEDSGVLRQPA
jgi:hypothetical protein